MIERERGQARWEDSSDKTWQRCTLCGVAVRKSAIKWVKASEDSNLNYCPHCGARMHDAHQGRVGQSNTQAQADSDVVTANEARRRYKQEWRRKNPDKVRASQRRYWQRKADQYNDEHFLPEHLISLMRHIEYERKACGEVKEGAMWRRVHKLSRYDENREQFNQDIADLERRGFIQITQRETSMQGGRPTREIVIMRSVNESA